MSFIEIGNPKNRDDSFFSSGFRPFFLAGVLFSIITIFRWMQIFALHVEIDISGITPYQWHAHEMIFGYVCSIIVGFLLTAITNWTGEKTIRDFKLGLLLLLWISARTLFLFGTKFIQTALLFDLIFMMISIVAITIPIFRVRQWSQLRILLILLFLFLCNFSFYLSSVGLWFDGARVGIYVGLYLIVMLILLISGRVVPGFIENGIGNIKKIKSPKWIEEISLFFFTFFIANEFFSLPNQVLLFLSASLFLVNSVKLYCWHDLRIWSRPLLLGLYLSHIFIVFGFVLFFFHFYMGVSKFLAIHSFSYGGIGFVTLSMIMRVSLGHTGRNIFEPPKEFKAVLILLFLGFIFRVLIPLVEPNGYVFYVFLAQILWIISFGLMVFSLSRILVKKPN